MENEPVAPVPNFGSQKMLEANAVAELKDADLTLVGGGLPVIGLITIDK